MGSILDLAMQVFDQWRHNFVQIGGDVFCGAAASRDDRSAGIVWFMNLGQEVKTRGAWCCDNEIFSRMRELTIKDHIIHSGFHIMLFLLDWITVKGITRRSDCQITVDSPHQCKEVETKQQWHRPCQLA